MRLTMPLPFEQLKPMSGIRWIEYLAPFLCGGIVEVLFVLGATLLGWEATLLGLLIFAFYKRVFYNLLLLFYGIT